MTTLLPNLITTHVGRISDASTMARCDRIAAAAYSQATERCVQIITFYDFIEQSGPLSGIPLLALWGDSNQSLPYDAVAELIEASQESTGMRREDTAST